MANFLITSANTLTEGGAGNNTVVIQTAALLGSTVYAGSGNDLISAQGGGNGTNSITNGQQGNDTITIGTAATFTNAKIVGGGGNDFISANTAVNISNNSILHGGNGADTISLISSTIAGSTINGNGGNDFITAEILTLSASLLALGGGNDTLTIDSAVVTTSTIAMGGGDDLFSAETMAASASNQLRIEGDTIGDTEFYGNDTIRITDGSLGISALVQGGGGADHILISANISGGSTINGNAGKDSINFAGTMLTAGDITFAGGAGNDTITITAALVTASTDTIFGGGGDDVIDLVSANVTGGAIQIQGGAGADTIALGATTGGGSTAVNIRYTAFSDSNIAAYDYVSATDATDSGFVISQTVVSANTAASVNAGGADGVETDVNGTVSAFGANVGTSVTARATVLDSYLSVGQTASFQDGGGNNYLFMQAGAAGSGADGDLLIQFNGEVSGMTIAAGTAIEIDLG
jgi:hypothetical protein